MYYIFIENNKINGCGQCQCANDDVQNIEVSKEVFDSFIEDNLTYIWDGTNIIANPNYEEDKQNRENEERNREIDDKIKDLQEMSVKELLNGNTENVELYKQVIEGLESARP